MYLLITFIGLTLCTSCNCLVSLVINTGIHVSGVSNYLIIYPSLIYLLKTLPCIDFYYKSRPELFKDIILLSFRTGGQLHGILKRVCSGDSSSPPANSSGCHCPPLVAAIKCGQVALVRILLRHGADPNCGTERIHTHSNRNESYLPLVNACRKENTELAALLLKSGARVRLRDSDGRSAMGVDQLYTSHNYGNSKKIFNLLIRFNGNVNEVCNSSGQTPVQLACQYGNNEIVGFLLEKGSNVNVSHPQTCIHYACCSGSARVLELLLSTGLQLSPQAKLCFSIPDASEGGELSMVFLRNGCGDVAIQWAIRNEQLAFLEKILERGDRRVTIPIPKGVQRSMSVVCWMLLARSNVVGVDIQPNILTEGFLDHNRTVMLFLQCLQPGRFSNKHQFPTEKLKSTTATFDTIPTDEQHPYQQPVNLVDVQNPERFTRHRPPSLLVMSVASVRDTLSRVIDDASLLFAINKLPLPNMIKRQLRLDSFIEALAPRDKSLPSIHDSSTVFSLSVNVNYEQSKHTFSPDTAVISFMLFMALVTLVLHIWKYYYL